MKSTVLAIVGAGATSVSLLASLAEAAEHAPFPQGLTIFVIDTRRFAGRGLAYDFDVPSNLLNTRAGFITPFAGKPGHFYRWLQENKCAWQDEFPELTVDRDTFAPRPLFGLYLEYMMNDIAGRFAQCGVSLVPIRAEVIQLRRTPANDLHVVTDTALTIRADYAVLCCGNLPSKEYAEFHRFRNFFTSPYPVRRLAKAIPRDAKVAIVGARLSAIDAAVGLAASGHRGPMTMISRSGYYPSVRGTQSRYEPAFATLPKIQELVGRRGRLSLAELFSVIAREIRHAGGTVPDLAKLPPAPPADPISFFESEIAAAGGPRPWQAVLYSTNAFIDWAWQWIEPLDQKRFLEAYQPAWLSYRVSIPVENARRIVALAKSGQLAFQSGAVAIAPHSGGGFTLENTALNTTEDFDAVICAFGTPRKAANLASPLVQDLFASGVARAHPFGGIDVVPGTGNVVDARSLAIPNLWAIGELTNGAYFFTSVLEINARHATRVALHIAEKIRRPPRYEAEAQASQSGGANQGQFNKKTALTASGAF